MSVYLSDRGENKFEVLVKARELAVYTIQITHNKNVFSDYDTIVNDLQKLGKDIFIELWYANNCDLRSESELRLQYQKKAIRDCYALLATIQIGKNIKNKKRKYKRLLKKAHAGEVSKEYVDECFSGFLANLDKVNCYNLKQRLIKWYEVIWDEICKN